MIEIDANGLSCPEPVILLKRAMASGGPIRISVDSQTSAAACGRFAESKNYSAETVKSGGSYVLTLVKNE